MERKADPLDSRPYSSSSLSFRGIICHPAPCSITLLDACYPRSFHSFCRLTLMTPSNQPGFGEIAINRNRYGVTNRLSFPWENDVQVFQSSIPLQYRIPLQHPDEPFIKVMRATLPETGRRVDDLFNRQDQRPEFALISFLTPSSKNEGQAG